MEENLTKTVKKNGIFENPWKTWRFPGFTTFMKWRVTSSNNTNLPNDPTVNLIIE
jgi:hypothetical protein